MIIISHRGNIAGPDSLLENNPDHINTLLRKKQHVEVDVWYFKKCWFLGHDTPTYKVNLKWLTNKFLWLHCKNFEALNLLIEQNVNCFWHETDKFTITSKKYIWTYPNNVINKLSVIVDTSQNWRKNQYQCYGVCVDYL